jgi:hypothetical protein
MRSAPKSKCQIAGRSSPGAGGLLAAPASTPPFSLPKLTHLVDRKIRRLHLSAEAGARQSVAEALHCGALLIQRRAQCPHGQWLPYLRRVGIPQPTACRYMACAERFELNGGRMEPKTLTGLYREYRLLPPTEAGGVRSLRLASSDPGQCHFNFDLFDGLMHLIEARGPNPFLKVCDRAALEASRRRTVRALELLDEALVKTAGETAVALPQTLQARLTAEPKGES